MHKKSLFLFTRDLRLIDNTALLKCQRDSHEVVCLFVFNPDQVVNSKYKSNASIQFMCESLKDLDGDLRRAKSKLHCCYGQACDVVLDVIKKNSIDAVYISMDYSPFAKKRELSLSKLCTEQKISFYKYEDYMITGVCRILKNDGSSYVKFTPYYNQVINYLKNNKLQKESPLKKSNFSKTDMLHDAKYTLKTEYGGDFYQYDKNVIVRGGRLNAMKKMSKLGVLNYPTKDSIDKSKPASDMSSTTMLSAYIKFGCVSIREVCSASSKLSYFHTLFRQLIWRDFYMMIMYHNPHVLGNNMKDVKINWVNNRTIFENWCLGTTNLPIIDAGMRQLNKEGWMPNRLRLLTSNYLVKQRVDWRWGERYFASRLVDYDISNNNGNWQWVSSTGVESQPYFRTFNLFNQSKKYDSECVYIKKYVDELRSVSCDKIHEMHIV